MPLDPTILDVVANTNAKVVMDNIATMSGLAMGDAVAHQRTTNATREAAMAALTKNFAAINPIKSVGTLKAISGNDLAQAMAALGSAVAMLGTLKIQD